MGSQTSAYLPTLVDQGQSRQVRTVSQGQAGHRKIIRKVNADVATRVRTRQPATVLSRYWLQCDARDCWLLQGWSGRLVRMPSSFRLQFRRRGCSRRLTRSCATACRSGDPLWCGLPRWSPGCRPSPGDQPEPGSDSQPNSGHCNVHCNLTPDTATFSRTGHNHPHRSYPRPATPEFASRLWHPRRPKRYRGLTVAYPSCLHHTGSGVSEERRS
jgi:hypothetical protein